MTKEETLDMCHSLVSALEFMHTNNIVHGDIKRENIFFDAKSHQAYLSDLGTGIEQGSFDLNDLISYTTKCFIFEKDLEALSDIKDAISNFPLEASSLLLKAFNIRKAIDVTALGIALAEALSPSMNEDLDFYEIDEETEFMTTTLSKEGKQALKQIEKNYGEELYGLISAMIFPDRAERRSAEEILRLMNDNIQNSKQK